MLDRLLTHRSVIDEDSASVTDSFNSPLVSSSYSDSDSEDTRLDHSRSELNSDSSLSTIECPVDDAVLLKNSLNVNLKKKVSKIGQNYPNDVWVESSNCQLSFRDRNKILSGQPIDERVMNYALKLIDQHLNKELEFPFFGFHDISARTSPQVANYERSEGRFIQTLKLCNNHYIVVTDQDNFNNNRNAKAKIENSVFVYDCYTHLSFRKKENELKYSVGIIQDVCDLMQNLHSLGSVDIFVKDIQQIESTALSGFIAIVTTYLLTKQINPASVSIDTQNWTYDLITFLETKTFEDRTVQPYNRKTDDVYLKWSEKLFCHCHQPDYGNRMLLCDSCKNWYHEQCETFSFHDLDTCKRDKCTKWYCKDCLASQVKIEAKISKQEVKKKVSAKNC